MDPSSLKDLFERGRIRALAPTTDRDGVYLTSLQSPWLFRDCPICGHDFRIDDTVFVSGGTVIHAGGALDCRGGEPILAVDPALSAAFLAGLYQAWPQVLESHSHSLDQDHPLLAAPLGRIRRATCAVCGHTLRPGEQVVICPCQPDQPCCRLAVHHDPLRGQTCWSDYAHGDGPSHCLTTGRPLRFTTEAYSC